MRTLLFLAAAMFVVPAQADQALTAEARQQVKAFATTLGGTLKASMKKDGPVAAIQVCNTEAPEIADKLSKNGWEVARTSLKIRNPDNAPDTWEMSVLQDFDARIKAGESPAKMEASKTENGEFRYMKAIPTGAVCLACHGAEVAAPVEAKLAELYPQDHARGFNMGDLRGAFTLRKSVGE